MPEYYRCGICDCYHPANWDGDCRDDSHRFAIDQLDDRHGAHGWKEVDIPNGTLNPQRYLPGGTTS